MTLRWPTASVANFASSPSQLCPRWTPWAQSPILPHAPTARPATRLPGHPATINSAQEPSRLTAIIASGMQRWNSYGMGFDVRREVYEVDQAGVERYHDLVFLLLDGTKLVADVTVAAIPEQSYARIAYPSAERIAAKASEIASAPPLPPGHFFWEDHSAESISEEVALGRARRLLTSQAVVEPTIEAARRKKLREFASRFGQRPNEKFLPLPFTAGGGLGEEMSTLLNAVYTSLGSNTPKKIALRNRFYRRCSVALVIEGSLMSARCRPRV